MRNDNQNIVIVLGMHRSGTSAITRGLQVMGVELGNRLMPPLKDNNDKGFWEDLELNELNVELLDVINSDWYCLSPIEVGELDVLRNKGYLDRASALIREKISSNTTFGFKDPRMAKLLPFWKEVFSNCQIDANYVIAIRHPLSVVKSLTKRDDFEPTMSYLMWLGHVIPCLSGTIGYKRILIDYDRLMQSPAQQLKRIAISIGLQIDRDKQQIYIDDFLDPKLQRTNFRLHDLFDDATCPPLVREVYADLLDVTSETSTIDDVELQNKVTCWSNELDRIKSSLMLVDSLYKKMMTSVALNQSLSAKIQIRDNVISSILSSPSWRIGAPLRWLKKQFNAILKGF